VERCESVSELYTVHLCARKWQAQPTHRCESPGSTPVAQLHCRPALHVPYSNPQLCAVCLQQ
jgi:hypothetical protein